MIVSIASGKGGTGKTTLAVNMALSLKNVQLLDCDVEEPNAHLLLHPKVEETKPVYVKIPVVEESNCDYCGWKFPLELLNKFRETKDSLLCENCGTEILFEVIKSNDQFDNINDNYNKREKLSCRYNANQEEKNPIARVQFSPSFQICLKIILN